MNSKRVNVAGSQEASYLQRLLQLKYPGHVAAITLSRMEELLHEHSYTAVDYHGGTVCKVWHTNTFYEQLKDLNIDLKCTQTPCEFVHPFFLLSSQTSHRAGKVAQPRVL